MIANDNEGTLACAAGQSSTTPQPIRLITKAELRRIVPYSPQHILRLEKRGLFPRRVQVGDNRVGWLLAEIEHWIAVRVAERDACTKRAVEREQQITYQNEKRTRARR